MKHTLALKMFCTGAVLLMSGLAHASQSSSDIQAILADSSVQNLIGANEINSITNYGRRRYNLAFGNCSAQVLVVSTCAPAPGGPCSIEVQLNTSSVNCLP